MTPTMPKHEDMRLDLSLNVTPEGSLADLLTAVGHMVEDRERKNQFPEERPQGTPSETANVGISDTQLKTKLESNIREAPRRIQRTREASREEALASTQQFFATVDERNRNKSTGRSIGESSEVCGRDNIDVPCTSTSVVTTTPVILDVKPIDTSSPRVYSSKWISIPTYCYSYL